MCIAEKLPLHPHDINGVLHNVFQKSIHCYKHKIDIAAENEHDCLCWSADMGIIGVVRL